MWNGKKVAQRNIESTCVWRNFSYFAAYHFVAAANSLRRRTHTQRRYVTLRVALLANDLSSPFLGHHKLCLCVVCVCVFVVRARARHLLGSSSACVWPLELPSDDETLLLKSCLYVFRSTSVSRNDDQLFARIYAVDSSSTNITTQSSSLLRRRRTTRRIITGKLLLLLLLFGARSERAMMMKEKCQDCGWPAI